MSTAMDIIDHLVERHDYVRAMAEATPPARLFRWHEIQHESAELDHTHAEGVVGIINRVIVPHGGAVTER